MNQPNFDASSDPHRDPTPTGPAESLEASLPLDRGETNGGAASSAADGKVPFLGIHFKCCGTYGRIYRSHLRYVYEGRCPKCRRLLTVPIGPGGLDSRFLSAQ